MCCALAVMREVTDVLDLGSGFGSAAFRTVLSVPVASVDTSSQWLARTSAFIAGAGLPQGTLRTWEDQTRVRHRYGMVVYDAGDMSFRRKHLSDVWPWVRPGGLLVLDDAHDRLYHREARAFLAAHKVTMLDVRGLSTDRFHRFVLVAERQ